MPDAVLPTVKSERAAVRQLEASCSVGIGEVLPLQPRYSPCLSSSPGWPLGGTDTVIVSFFQ